MQPDVHRYIQEHFFDLFVTLADLKKKLLVTRQSVSSPIDLYLAEALEATRKIRNLEFQTVTVFSIDKSVVENYSFGEAQITSGSVEFEHADAAYSIDIVQIPGKEHGKLFVRPEKRTEKQAKESKVVDPEQTT